MSFTSPTFMSVHPLALFTSMPGSHRLIHSTIRGVSYWPQPSLNGTHMTMLGWLRRPAHRAARLRIGAPIPAFDRRARVVLGMSCQTSRPKVSAQYQRSGSTFTCLRAMLKPAASSPRCRSEAHRPLGRGRPSGHQPGRADHLEERRVVEVEPKCEAAAVLAERLPHANTRSPSMVESPG